MGDVLDYLSGPGFAEWMRDRAPGASPFDDDYRSAREFRDRYVVAAVMSLTARRRG